MLGVGGSAFATPALRLALGLPGVVAVATPLAATIPSALAGAVGYLRRGIWDPRVAAISIIAGVPGVVAGSLVSEIVSGRVLLVLSGVFLLAAGLRFMVGGTSAKHAQLGTPIVAASTFVIGFLSGLLANGGGFLLIPLYVLMFGLDMHVAAATSLVVVAAYSIPGLIVHAALGHIDWSVAARFAAGSIPAAVVGSRLGLRMRSERLRVVFGGLLVAFAIFFIARELL